MKKHYLNKDSSRWYIKINNIADEINTLYKGRIIKNFINIIKFLLLKIIRNNTFSYPYYITFDENGLRIIYSSLRDLKQGEK